MFFDKKFWYALKLLTDQKIRCCIYCVLDFLLFVVNYNLIQTCPGNGDFNSVHLINIKKFQNLILSEDEDFQVFFLSMVHMSTSPVYLFKSSISSSMWTRNKKPLKPKRLTIQWVAFKCDKIMIVKFSI